MVAQVPIVFMKNIRNIGFDTSENFSKMVQRDKSNSIFSKMEKYITVNILIQCSPKSNYFQRCAS